MVSVTSDAPYVKVGARSSQIEYGTDTTVNIFGENVLTIGFVLLIFIVGVKF